MKKFIFLIWILATLFLTVACSGEALTTAPESSVADNTDTSAPAQSTTAPLETAKAIFNTENIKSVTLYVNHGGGEGKVVPDAALSEMIDWLDTFVIDQKAEDPIPPGTNYYYVKIEYLDGTAIKQGLDLVEIDGCAYYVTYGEAPDCFWENLPEEVEVPEWMEVLEEGFFDKAVEIDGDYYIYLTFQSDSFEGPSIYV